MAGAPEELVCKCCGDIFGLILAELDLEALPEAICTMCANEVARVEKKPPKTVKQWLKSVRKFAKRPLAE